MSRLGESALGELSVSVSGGDGECESALEEVLQRAHNFTFKVAKKENWGYRNQQHQPSQIELEPVGQGCKRSSHRAHWQDRGGGGGHGLRAVEGRKAGCIRLRPSMTDMFMSGLCCLILPSVPLCVWVHVCTNAGMNVCVYSIISIKVLHPPSLSLSLFPRPAPLPPAAPPCPPLSNA